MQKLEATKKSADHSANWILFQDIPEIEDDLTKSIATIEREAANSTAKAKAKAAARTAEAQRNIDEHSQISRDAKQQLDGLLKEHYSS